MSMSHLRRSQFGFHTFSTASRPWLLNAGPSDLYYILRRDPVHQVDNSRFIGGLLSFVGFADFCSEAAPALPELTRPNIGPCAGNNRRSSHRSASSGNPLRAGFENESQRPRGARRSERTTFR